jgi:hypothetical protein
MRSSGVPAALLVALLVLLAALPPGQTHMLAPVLLLLAVLPFGVEAPDLRVDLAVTMLTPTILKLDMVVVSRFH